MYISCVKRICRNMLPCFTEIGVKKPLTKQRWQYRVKIVSIGKDQGISKSEQTSAYTLRVTALQKY